jgi:glutaredoxin-related protein
MSAQQQPYLFYSKRCANSSQVIETLKALNKASLYKFVEVETLGAQLSSLPFKLTKVPTLYIPTTKDVVIGKDIFGHIAKPATRNDVPNKDAAPMGNNAPDKPIGDLSPWGFEGGGRLTESYSSWNTPTNFTNDGNSMYTFLGGVAQIAGALAPAGPETKNTIDDKSKTGSNDDVKQRMEMMEKQREKEFSQPDRK